MKKKIIIILFVCMAALFGFIAGDYVLINKVEVTGSLFLTDNLENVYVIQNYEIVKFNNAGVKTNVYSNNSLGKITCADVSDPLRIILFYKDFNQLVFLDNTLSEIGSPVLLDNFGAEMVELVCTSKEGGFWVFNSQANQLQYFDKTLRQVYRSVDLSLLVENSRGPEFLIERNERVYMNFPETGILVFDRFGSWYKTIPLKNLHSFQVADGKIIYCRENNLVRYDPELLSEIKIPLPDSSNVIDSRIEQSKCYIFKKDGFLVYSMN